jgi:hypothetical protein
LTENEMVQTSAGKSKGGKKFGMTIEQLRIMHQARPFEPFEIYLADGRAIGVDHPEFLSQSPTGRTISVGMPDGTHQVIDLLLVTSLKPKANGASHSKRSRR